MKIVLLLAAILLCNQAIFSQWVDNEDPLTIKELHLTRLQQNKIRHMNREAADEIHSWEQNKVYTQEITARVQKIRGARIKKIRNVLTAEQQTTWRKKLMENRPRRGVTGLPNERTVQ